MKERGDRTLSTLNERHWHLGEVGWKMVQSQVGVKETEGEVRKSGKRDKMKAVELWISWKVSSKLLGGVIAVIYTVAYLSVLSVIIMVSLRYCFLCLVFYLNLPGSLSLRYK